MGLLIRVLIHCSRRNRIHHDRPFSPFLDVRIFLPALLFLLTPFYPRGVGLSTVSFAAFASFAARSFAAFASFAGRSFSAFAHLSAALAAIFFGY